mmetsp:Transcript_20536/g.38953  ORF Transcript_20536/g.38953 Transcript_20536/m.38953 type:complete len:114 (-) Transcript_20536:137-478(-)|eukprot:scaffold2671_cov167-Amphora_coffeaeformis.AAC.4
MDYGATIFALPVGTRAWGASFDMLFGEDENGTGILVQVKDSNDQVIFSTHLVDDFIGFLGVAVVDDDETTHLTQVKISHPMATTQRPETYLIDNMHVGSRSTQISAIQAKSNG